jgi:hypothetical protein
MTSKQILEFQKWLASNDASTYVDITEKVNDIAQTALDALQRVEEVEKKQKDFWYKLNSMTGYIEGMLAGKKFPEISDTLKEINEFLDENK